MAVEILVRGGCGVAAGAPPTVLGFYMLLAMGPRGALGKLWSAAFGHGLAFTFAGLVIASVLYSLPFAVQPLIASFETIDRKLLDASAVLGAGDCARFFASFCLCPSPAS